MDDTLQIPTQKYVPAIDSYFPRVNQTYPLDVSIARKAWVVVYPTNHDTNYLRDSFAEFTIDSEPGSFLDFRSFHIEYELKLLKTDDGAPADDSNVVFTNGLILALSKSRKLFLNNQLVESDYQSNYTQYVNTLLTENEDYISHQGQPMGYFSEPSIIDNTPNKAGMPNANTVMAKRIEFSKQEKVHLYGPLNLDIGKANMMMVDRVSARLYFELADTTQLVLKGADDAENYKIKIFSVKLHFKRITPVENAYLEFNKSLLSNNLEYFFERNLIYKNTVTAGQRQVFLSQIFGSLIPNKLHIMMVNQAASIGNDKRNGYYFNHFHLDNIKITVNGLSVLDSDVSFPSKYSTLYKRVTDAMRTKKHSLSFSQFGAGRCILSVDCQNSETDSILQLEKRGHLEINMRFAGALAENMNIIIIGCTLGSIQIDSDWRITTHFNY